MQKVSRNLNAFLNSLEDDSIIRNSKSMILPDPQTMTGGVTNPGNCGDCSNSVEGACSTNGKNCTNFGVACSGSTNGGKCSNLPKREVNYTVIC